MNVVCWLFGHDDSRWFARGRVTVRCARCGSESPGLAHDKAGPKPRKVRYKTVAERRAPQRVLPMKVRRRA